MSESIQTELEVDGAKYRIVISDDGSGDYVFQVAYPPDWQYCEGLRRANNGSDLWKKISQKLEEKKDD